MNSTENLKLVDGREAYNTWDYRWHSHIIIERGVNEGTQASSAEVWIGSSLNSEDVNMYRQLAGGLHVLSFFTGQLTQLVVRVQL